MYQDTSVKKPKTIVPQSKITGRQKRIITKVVQVDWKKDANYRDCMREINRAYETVISWDEVASGPRKITQ